MSKEKSLYWSSFSKYEGCGQSFLWGYGAPGVDLGGGLGMPKPKPKQRSEHDAIMGNTIQYVIEHLYNDHYFERVRDPNPATRWSARELASKLQGILKQELESRLSKAYIDWSWAPSQKDMEQVCMSGVIGYLVTMKANFLSGDWNCAEKKYVAYLKDVPIAARVDLIFRRDDLEKPLPGVTILDGKNAKTKGKYTDTDQLLFYALVYYLSSGKFPDRVGFVYYRYPYGTPKEDGGVESGVDWVPIEKEKVHSLAQRILDARAGIDAGRFDANPTPSRCKFCDYEDVCPQRQEQKKANSQKRKPKEEILPSFNPDNDGFEEI